MDGKFFRSGRRGASGAICDHAFRQSLETSGDSAHFKRADEGEEALARELGGVARSRSPKGERHSRGYFLPQRPIHLDLGDEGSGAQSAPHCIEEVHPVAPVHILIMTKKNIPNLQSVEPGDWPMIAEVLKVARQIAKEKGVEEGYRLLTNNGPDAGQTVFHLHFHLIAGRVLGKKIGRASCRERV